MFLLSKDLTCIAALHGGSLVVHACHNLIPGPLGYRLFPQHAKERTLSLDRFNKYHSLYTKDLHSGTKLELMTRRLRVCDLYNYTTTIIFEESDRVC
ncbi:hypothetical protein TNCV_1456561 [Trichonephila clavipes]|nr:hypothetical protein TNCV_1456561 [Trichonephila clavipes]